MQLVCCRNTWKNLHRGRTIPTQIWLLPFSLGLFFKVLFVFLLSILFSLSVFSQTTIWSEDFDTYTDDTGIDGSGNIGDYPALVTKWSIDASNCTLSNSQDYLKVKSGYFQGRDVDGVGLWKSVLIDISSYSNVSVSADIWKVGGTMESADYIYFDYKLDGGSWTEVIHINGDTNTSPQYFSVSNLNGSTLELRVQIRNDQAQEAYAFDNVLVEGTLKAPPNCTTPSSPVDNETDVAVSSTLSWNASSGATGYYLYFGTDVAASNIENGTDLGNVTSYSPSSSLGFLTNYYWKIVPYNTYGSATGCAVWGFTTADISYCIPANNTGTGDGDYISLVQLETINNSTGASASPYYIYYNSLSTDLTIGSSYTITLGVGTFYNNNNIAAWIDFNHDGDFDDSGEKLGELNSLSGSATGTINFSVPAGSVSGETRLRVREAWSITGMDACVNYDYGETEDYNVNLLVPCNSPDVPTLSASSTVICEGESTSISITSGNLNDADHWQWYSGSCGGAAVGQGTLLSVSPTTTTTYYARGEGNCDGTACANITVSVLSFVPDFSSIVTDATCPDAYDGSIQINNTVDPAIEFAYADNDYIDLGSSLLSNMSQFTIEGWINVNMADIIGSRVGSLFGQNDAIEFGFFDSGTITCWTLGGGSVSVGSSLYPSDNDWHHIAVVGDGESLVLYIDGVSAGSGGNTGVTDYGSSTYSAKIGGGIWDATGGSLSGKIKSVGFWNTALDAGEITQLANTFSYYTGAESNLIAGYNFYEGNGSTVSSLPAGNNGTFQNSPVWIETYTYSWTKTGDGSFSASTKNLSNISSGEYNLIVGLPGNCDRTKSFTVGSDNNVPSVSTITIPPPFCENDSYNPGTPTVTDNGSAVISQGWEMETTVGSGIFTPFTVPYTVLATDNNKKVRYFAENLCGTGYSNEVLLAVIAIPVFTTQPVTLDVCEESSGDFTVTTSAVTPTFQWQYSTSADPSNWFDFSDVAGEIVGATTDNLQILLANISWDGLNVSCMLSANGCSVRSDVVQLNVYPLPATGEITTD